MASLIQEKIRSNDAEFFKKCAPDLLPKTSSRKVADFLCVHRLHKRRKDFDQRYQR
jgi:hypothetical protein